MVAVLLAYEYGVPPAKDNEASLTEQKDVVTVKVLSDTHGVLRVVIALALFARITVVIVTLYENQMLESLMA